MTDYQQFANKIHEVSTELAGKTIDKILAFCDTGFDDYCIVYFTDGSTVKIEGDYDCQKGVTGVVISPEKAGMESPR
jgi:hypothetical protein